MFADDNRLKRSQIFTKGCPKITTSVLLKSDVLQTSQKATKYFVLLLKDFLSPKLLKVAQSGHTASTSDLSLHLFTLKVSSKNFIRVEQLSLSFVQ